MALVTRVFEALSNKLQKLQFSPVQSNIPVDDNSSSFYDNFTKKAEYKEIFPIQVPLSQTLDVEILEKKINQLKNKLKKKNVNLHVFDHTDIQYGGLLGQGSEGVVQRCKVQYNDFQIDAAVKTVLNSTEDVLDVTLHEIELLCLANDPIMSTVIQVYGVASVPMKNNPTRGHLVIVTEIGLQNLLHLYQGEPIPLHVTLKLWHDLCIAIHCMHCKNIIHQDLKPENVLVTSITRDSCGSLLKVKMKVIDLGMSMMVDRDKGGRVVTDDIPGTMGYHAPEVLFDDSYDFKADVFVLAVVFCVMLLPRCTLQTPDALQSFLKTIDTAKRQGLTGASLFFSVMQPHFDKHHNIPTSLLHLICKMLERAEERQVNLLSIANTCNNEATILAKHCPVQPPPPINDDSRDSGLISDGYKYYLRGKRRLSDDDEDNDGSDDDSSCHDDNRHFKDCFNGGICNDKDNDHITKLQFDSDKNDADADNQEHYNENEEVNDIDRDKDKPINSTDDNDKQCTLKDRFTVNNINSISNKSNNNENDIKDNTNDNNDSTNDNKNSNEVKKERNESKSSDEKKAVRFLRTRSKSFKKASVRDCKRPKIVNDDKADVSLLVKENNQKMVVDNKDDTDSCKVSRRSSFRIHSKTPSDFNPIVLKKITENAKDVSLNRESESGSERLRNATESTQKQETSSRTPSRILTRSNTITSNSRTTDKNILNNTIASSSRKNHRKTLNKSMVSKSICNRKMKNNTAVSDVDTIANTGARTTRAAAKPKQFSRSVDIDCNKDKKMKEEDDYDNDDSERYAKKNIVSTNNLNIRYVTRKLAKITLNENKTKQNRNKSRIEVMKLTYDISSNNLIEGEKSVEKDNPLTRSALKRNRRK